MRQCPNCYTANNDASQFCESCGTRLQQGETSRPTKANPVQYPVPEMVYAPPPPPYTQTSAPTYPSPQPSSTIQAIQKPTRKTRSVPGITWSIFQYILGSASAAIGLSGIITITNNNTILGITFIAYSLISLLALILILIFYHRPRIRTWKRILFFILGTILGAAAVFASYMHLGQPYTSIRDDIPFGSIIAIYGLCMQIIALR